MAYSLYDLLSTGDKFIHTSNGNPMTRLNEKGEAVPTDQASSLAWVLNVPQVKSHCSSMYRWLRYIYCHVGLIFPMDLIIPSLKISDTIEHEDKFMVLG